MTIQFKKMTEQDLPLWEKWIKLPHVSNIWFLDAEEGEESLDRIREKTKGNGHTVAFIILLDDLPIGYIQYCDLYAYQTLLSKPSSIFSYVDPKTYSIDLFIAEVNLLNKGLGTKIVELFRNKLIEEGAKKILIDPAATNKRAIRCYEKAGFCFFKTVHNKNTSFTVMEYPPGSEKPQSPTF